MYVLPSRSLGFIISFLLIRWRYNIELCVHPPVKITVLQQLKVFYTLCLHRSDVC